MNLFDDTENDSATVVDTENDRPTDIESSTVTFGFGRNKTSRIVPIWFSTWPFSQPDAGVQATGSTR